MDFLEAEDFALTYPIRIITLGEEVDRTTGRLKWNRLEAMQVEDVLCLPLFTDEDVAERYRVTHSIHVETMEHAIVADSEVLLYWRRNAKSVGFAGVVLDPGRSGRPVRCGLIDWAIKSLE